jgi:hypothetical protein
MIHDHFCLLAVSYRYPTKAVIATLILKFGLHCAMHTCLIAKAQRISVPHLKESIKVALRNKARILAASLPFDAGTETDNRPNLFGEDVKIVNKITKPQRLLSPAEKDEIVVKYNSGMSMAAVADFFGCHYTTIGRILRRKGVVIPE